MYGLQVSSEYFRVEDAYTKRVVVESREGEFDVISSELVCSLYVLLQLSVLLRNMSH